MEKLTRIESCEITLGDALPWPLYNAQGWLLFERGQIISSRRHLEALLTCGLYRGPETPPEAALESLPCIDDNQCVFDIISQIPPRLSQALTGLAQGKHEYQGRIIRLARELQHICKADPNAALGAVHLFHDGPYPIVHLIHTAILCELISMRLGYRPERRIPLLCATMTSNISIIKLQEELHLQTAPLTEEQCELIQHHPEDSARILKQAGVTGELWLKTVLQHHERIDGSGYGGQLKGSEIIMDARIMALADIYSAMITPRKYRAGMPAKEALRELFLTRGKNVDNRLSEVFIKELGVFPPGAFVEMNNGELGIVIQRGRDYKHPQVSILIGPKGQHYANPIIRDGKTEPHRIRRPSPDPIDFPINLRRIWNFN